MAEINQIDFGDGVTRDLRDTSAIKWTQAEGSVKKNLLDVPSTIPTISGLTITTDANKHVKINGTAGASGAIIWNEGYTLHLKAGSYKLIVSPDKTMPSGSFNIRNSSEASIAAINLSTELTKDFTVASDTDARAFLNINSGNVYNDITIGFMIMDASIADNTYVPYIPDNMELDAKINVVKAATGADEDAGVNLLPIGASTSTKNDVTCTVNSDKSIKLSGTASASGEFVLFEGGIDIPASIFSIGVIKNASTNAIVRVSGTEYLIPVDKTYVEIPAGTLDLCKVFFNQYFSQTGGVTYYPMVYPKYVVNPSFKQYVPSVQKQVVGYTVTGTNSASEKARNTLGLSFPVQMRLEVFVANGAGYGVGTVYRVDSTSTPTVTMLATSGLTFAKNESGTIQALMNNAAVTSTYKYTKI